MQVALAGIFILALVALVAGPVMARRAAATDSPTIVAAVDAFDGAKGAAMYKLDTLIKGGVRVEAQAGKITDKWRITSVNCNDVTVVALSNGTVVTSVPATTDPLDPAACVYSMKVPSGVNLSLFATLRTAQSIGITSTKKAADKLGSGQDKVFKSDLVTEKFYAAGPLKGAPKSVKFRAGDTASVLPLYIKLDN